MKEILHRLRLLVYPNIDEVLYIPGDAGFLPTSQDNLSLFHPLEWTFGFCETEELCLCHLKKKWQALFQIPHVCTYTWSYMSLYIYDHILIIHIYIYIQRFVCIYTYVCKYVYTRALGLSLLRIDNMEKTPELILESHIVQITSFIREKPHILGKLKR